MKWIAASGTSAAPAPPRRSRRSRNAARRRPTPRAAWRVPGCTSPRKHLAGEAPRRKPRRPRRWPPGAGNASAPRAARSRPAHRPWAAHARNGGGGDAGARRRSGRAAGSSGFLATRRTRATWRARRQTSGDLLAAARQRCGRRIQPMLRGLRIAANRSANIGGSLTTPAHWRPARPKRTRYVVAVLQDVGRLAARAMRHRTPRSDASSKYSAERWAVRMRFQRPQPDPRAWSAPKRARDIPRPQSPPPSGDLGHVVGRRDLHHVHAGEVQPRSRRRIACACHEARPPISGVPVPGAKAGSSASISKLR